MMKADEPTIRARGKWDTDLTANRTAVKKEDVDKERGVRKVYDPERGPSNRK